MSSYRTDRERYLLFARIIVVVAALGAVALIFANLENNPTHLAYSLIAFIVSATALVMTILQNLSISQQIRTTERSARLMHETAERLEELVKKESALARDVREDIELDHEILAALQEHGVGANDEERHAVAKRIATKIKTAATKR